MNRITDNMLRRFLYSYAMFKKTKPSFLAETLLQMAAISWCRVFESKNSDFSAYKQVGRSRLLEEVPDLHETIDKMKKFRNLCSKGEEIYYDVSFFDDAVRVTFSLEKLMGEEELKKYYCSIASKILILKDLE